MKEEIEALKKKLGDAGLGTEVAISTAAAGAAAAEGAPTENGDNGGDGGGGGGGGGGEVVDPAAMALALERAQANMEAQIAMQDAQRQKKMDEVRAGLREGCGS